MSAAEKPVPVPSDDNRPYWEGAHAHKLVLPRCAACGWYYAQPRIVCSSCRGEAFEWVETSGKGTIFTFTDVHQTTAPGFGDEIPYVVVHVSLDEQPQCVLSTNLVGEFDPDTLDL